MAKPYKIKRYRQYGGGNSFRARPHPLTIILAIIAVVALFGAGYFLFQPIYDLITRDHASDVSLPESEPEMEAEPVVEPDPEPVRTVGGLRGAYLPAETARSPEALTQFLEGLSGSDINAVMLDIKDASGTLLYRSSNENALQWGAVAENAVDLAALAAALEQNGLSLIVRMSAFRDPLASGADRSMAISYQQTEWLWLDAAQENGGKPWLNPYSDQARAYLSSLAVEAARAGAAMVVLENLQFPNGSTTNANFGPSADTISRSQALKSFVDDLSGQLLEEGARTAVYVTASSLTQESDNTTRYGGSPLSIAGETLMIGALPYQFSSGATLDDYVLEDPVGNAGNTTETILRYVSAQLGEGTAIIPLLQGGAEPDVAFTKEQVDAQIHAVTTRELGEYMLYCTTGEYLIQ